MDGEGAHAVEGRGLAIDGAGGRPGGAPGELILADLVGGQRGGNQPLISRLVGVNRSFPGCDGAHQRFTQRISRRAWLGVMRLSRRGGAGT